METAWYIGLGFGVAAVVSGVLGIVMVVRAIWRGRQ